MTAAERTSSCDKTDVDTGSEVQVDSSSVLQWPDIWNISQIDHFTPDNDWLFAQNGFLGCTVCRKATTAGLSRTHRLNISAEWSRELCHTMVPLGSRS